MTFSSLLKPLTGAHDWPATETLADLRAHVARLDLPDGEVVDWVYVRRVASKWLTEEGKDLLLACYAAFAPLALDCEPNAQDAIAFLHQFIESYWETMTPPLQRPRARANCIAWFITRLKAVLPAHIARLSDADREGLHQAWCEFSSLLTLRLGPHAPSTVAVLRLTQPPPRHAPRADSQLVAPGPQSPAASTPAAPQTPTPQTQDCRSLARSLCLLTQHRRQDDPMDLQACRLWRVGLWLNVHIAPAIVGDDVTRVLALPADVRARLTQAQQNGQYAQMFALAEHTMFAHPLCLDLQYDAASALTQMGGAHLAIAELILSETQALCRRLPQLLTLKAADKSPLAACETQAWLRVHTHQNEASAPHSLATRRPASRARRQFLRRLQRASEALDHGPYDLAEAAFDRLGRDVRRYRLDIWEPRLACQAAKGHLQALLKQTPPELPRVRSAYRRWAVLDPKEAQAHAALSPSLPSLGT